MTALLYPCLWEAVGHRGEDQGSPNGRGRRPEHSPDPCGSSCSPGRTWLLPRGRSERQSPLPARALSVLGESPVRRPCPGRERTPLPPASRQRRPRCVFFFAALLGFCLGGCLRPAWRGRPLVAQSKAREGDESVPRDAWAQQIPTQRGN